MVLNAETLSLINLIFIVMLTIGGIFAYKQGFSKAAGEIQERVINALQVEISTLKDSVDHIETENKRLNAVLAAIRVLLIQRGLTITISGETVMIADDAGKRENLQRIQETK